jgi:OOP family OmpA-OmpF porin
MAVPYADQRRVCTSLAPFWLLTAGLLASLPASAAEIITAEDIEQEVIRTEQLVRLVDNAIFLLDTSSSMNDKYRDTGKSRLELVVSELTKRNAYTPELGYKFGFYVYTPWASIYEVETFNRKGVADALAALPKEGSGPTRLTRGLEKLEPILASLTGPTAVFVFSDGSYTGKRRPITIASRIVANHDVCFYVISTAREKQEAGIIERVAGLNECSRVIPLSNFLARAEYSTGALFEVRANAILVTRTETRTVGLEIDPLHFAFDSAELDATARAELDEAGVFLKSNPAAYVVIEGYSDNTGPTEYNLQLSRRRVESAGNYLVESYGIEDERFVLYWHGPKNPVASNDTREGRAKNRRIEMAVGGL